METDQGTSVPSESISDTSFVYWKFEPLIDLTHEKIKETKGQAIAIAQPWEDLKKLLMEKYYPARLVPRTVTPKSKPIDRYIRGLASAIRRNNGTQVVYFSKPSAINPGYDIEITNVVKVETNKVVRGCRLELEEVYGEHHKGNLKQLKTMKSKEEHGVHLKLILKLLEKEKLFRKFLKCEFWLQEVHVLGHVVNSEEEQGNCIHIRTTQIHEKNYTTHDLELGAVVFALKTWRYYLYGTRSVIYTDHKSLQHIFDQKELNMRQRRWIELFSDYDCEIRYHPSKVNVVADALSRKDWLKLIRARAMSMTIHSSIKAMILEAQSEASKGVNTPA
nr:putative reverse transcriptase domain-containing protein [Tanacetum cinerariifolium]